MGPIERRRRSRPAVSGLVAGMFVFLMLFTIGTGFFIFVNNMNGAYDKTLSERANALQAGLSESLLLSTAAGENDHLTVTVTNGGGTNVNITDILVMDPGKALHAYGIGFASDTTPALPSPVNVAATSPSFDTGLTIAPGTYTVKVLTARGNTYVTTYPIPRSSVIETLLSSFVATNGSSVFDTATLSGVTSSAGGNVTYSYFSGGLCQGAATVVSTVPVTNGSVPDSDPHSFNVIGSYSWHAVYTGDTQNGGSTSLCEPLAVTASPQCVPSQVNLCLATVAQGLGSVAIDWNSFRYYAYAACPTGTGGSVDGAALLPPTTSCALSPSKVTQASLAYSISSASWEASGAEYHVFSINMTNADPLQRTMTLDGWTQLWLSAFNLGNGGGKAGSQAYGLVLVTNTNGVPTAPLTTLTATPRVTIPYGHTVTLFFAVNAITGSNGDPNNYNGFTNNGNDVSPIFMLFHGTLGTQAFAENFPLTATYWLP